MLYVTDLNGNTEPLNHTQRVEKNEEVDGALSLMFTSFSHENNPGYALIEEELIVSVDGYDFRVKQLRETRNHKEVVALSTFYDLVGHWQHDIYGGTRSLRQFLAFVFDGTEWTYTVDFHDDGVFIPNFGENNVITLVDELMKVFGCEYKILPNKTVHFTKEIGPDNDAQFRYAHNVKTLLKSVDTTNLRTKITGIRPPSESVEDSEGNVEVPHHNGFRVTYTSPYAEKYGIIEAEPIINDDIQTEEEMLAIITNELTDYPETSIELDIAEMTNKEIGERIWLIYEPIKMPDGSFMEFQTRILKKVSTWRNGRFVPKSVVVGNTQRKSLMDLIVDAEIEISKNKKWTRSRIEQTNSSITLAVERFAGEMLDAYAFIELTAEGIRSEVADVAEEAESKITQTAKEIRLEVNDFKKDTASKFSQTAERITMEVTAINQEIDGVKSTASSNFSILANRISASVNESKSYTDKEIGDVKETAESNFSVLAGRITSAVSTSKSYTDSEVGKVESYASGQFSVLSGKIEAKADYEEVTALGSRINSVEWDLDAVEGQISQKVSTSDFTGETMLSEISQTSSNIKIQAKNIDLDGITRTNGTLQIGSPGSRQRLTFPNSWGEEAWIQANAGDYSALSLIAGDLHLNAGDNIYIGENNRVDVYPRGYWDFSSATVYGLNTGSNIDPDDFARSDTWGLGFGYSSGSNRLYVRIHGSDVGYITLT